MSSRRTLIICVAVVAGLFSAVSASAFLSGSDQRAYKGATLVKVFKVSKDVAKGYSGDDAISGEFVKSDEMPQEFRPATAVTDINTLRGKVAVTALSANQVVVDGMFVDPKVAQVTAAQRIPAGQVAVTVSVDQVKGVAGLLVPGDRVNIMVNVEGAQQTMYQNVQILFIGSTAAPEAGDTQAVANPGSGLLTFAVPQEAAAKIALAAAQPSGLYLTLVPPDYKPTEIPGATTGNLLSGSDTPYGP
ncbi:MAG: Flp pilus assembly protein CpaB [Actinobacteria bacterium]|nr:Flp pilus assembly protein CpaB [Actinomycetota bacterium]